MRRRNRGCASRPRQLIDVDRRRAVSKRNDTVDPAHASGSLARRSRKLPQVKTIGISAKITSEEALQFAANVAADLRARNFGVCFDYATADKLADRGKCVAKGDLGKHSDLLMTFGGDGTLLSVARHAPKNVPILGVNMGTLGFLTEVRVEDFKEVLERVLAGDYENEERVAFDVAV